MIGAKISINSRSCPFPSGWSLNSIAPVTGPSVIWPLTIIYTCRCLLWYQSSGLVLGHWFLKIVAVLSFAPGQLFTLPLSPSWEHGEQLTALSAYSESMGNQGMGWGWGLYRHVPHSSFYFRISRKSCSEISPLSAFFYSLWLFSV